MISPLNRLNRISWVMIAYEPSRPRSLSPPACGERGRGPPPLQPSLACGGGKDGGGRVRGVEGNSEESDRPLQVAPGLCDRQRGVDAFDQFVDMEQIFGLGTIRDRVPDIKRRHQLVI